MLSKKVITKMFFLEKGGTLMDVLQQRNGILLEEEVTLQKY